MMKKQKVLFVDRDGTLIVEPEDWQVDAFEKLAFLEDVIVYLKKIKEELGYHVVIVTNQDGLGTETYPEHTFWPVHDLMMDIFRSQGVTFEDVYIDRTFAVENHPNRKPNIGLIGKYLEGDYDLTNSFMVGDRYTDIKFAKNFGGKGILIGRSTDTDDDDQLDIHGLNDALALKTNQWKEIYEFLKYPERKSFVHRQTNETDIQVELLIDGKGKGIIHTGLGFFDHMLEQVAKHSGCDLRIEVKGDLHIDEHHTIEDTALALGEAFSIALGDKRGIERYGFLLPMDDVLAQVAIDFSGRPWLVWEASFKREKVGDMPTEMFMHFFKSFSDAAKCNLNIKAEGENEHHKIEAIFKGFAKSIKMAVKQSGHDLPSTKGVL
jgi:imidazoleglycerol-phosphate dehydratase/histidinol-phosphatase